MNDRDAPAKGRHGTARHTAWLLVAFGLAACTQAPPPPPPQQVAAAPQRADRVLVIKNKRQLYLMSHDHVLYSFPVALGPHPYGPKEEEGDQRTPEGLYMLDWRNASSHYYRAIHISYPNQRDVEEAGKRGVSPGGNVMIHGLPNGMAEIGQKHTAHDWTDGCIAVTDEQMDIIWRMVTDDTPIEIRP